MATAGAASWVDPDVTPRESVCALRLALRVADPCSDAIALVVCLIPSVTAANSLTADNLFESVDLGLPQFHPQNYNKDGLDSLQGFRVSRTLDRYKSSTILLP